MLLPNLMLKCDADMKMSFSIQPPVAAIEVPVQHTEDPVPFASIPLDILATIPTTIRDVLKCENRYTCTSIDARKLLVPLADVPQAYVASLLKLCNNMHCICYFKPRLTGFISPMA